MNSNSIRGGTIPIARVLQQIGFELTHLVEMLERIENAIESVVFDPRHRDDRALSDLQTVDVMFQSIKELSHFVRNIAEQASESWVVDSNKAASTIKLDGLAKRLCGNNEQAELIGLKTSE